MFSQNLSYGMMLQSALELQQKYQQNLPDNFPMIPQKLRTFKELTEQLINQVDYLARSHIQQSQVIQAYQQSLISIPRQRTQQSDFAMGINNLQEVSEDYQFDEQVTFNENEENRTNFMGSLDATEELISRFKQQIIDKDNMIAVLQKQVQKSIKNENIQYKYDLQNKRLIDLQSIINEKDSQISMLNMRLQQLENQLAVPTSTTNVIKHLHQESIRAASTPRPILSSKLTTATGNNTGNESVSLLRQSETPNYHNNNNKQLNQQSNKTINTTVRSSSQASHSHQRNFDMPLQQSHINNHITGSEFMSLTPHNNGTTSSSVVIGNSNFNTSLALNNQNHVNESSHHHFMMRCQTQAEIIEQLLKERETFTKQYINNSNQLTYNSDLSVKDKDSQNLESQLVDIWQSLNNIIGNDSSQPRHQIKNDNVTLCHYIKQNIETLSSQFNQLQQQAKLLSSFENVSSQNYDELLKQQQQTQNSNKQSQQFKSILADQSIQLINLSSNSPKLKNKTKYPQKTRSKSNKRDIHNGTIIDEEINKQLLKYETQIKQLNGKLQNEQYKTQKLQAAFQQIESIFRQEDNCNNSQDQDSNDKKILEQIQQLNHVHIQELVKLQQQNDDLKSTNDNLSKQVQMLQQSQNQQDNHTNSQKTIGPGNQFKRNNNNNAIKKVQGFFQSQFNSNNAQQSLASLVYSESTCSTNDMLLFKQQPQSQTDTTIQLQNMSTNPSHDTLLHFNIDSQKSLIQDTGIIIMNNQTQQSTHQHEIQKLKERIAVLEKEKSLLDLEYKQLIEKLQQEISELNIIKDSYDDEKCTNIKLLEDSEKKISEIQELQECIGKLQEQVKNMQDEYGIIVQKYDSQTKQVKSMAEAQVELKHLIDEERKAYNDDRDKYEIDFEKLQQSHETKLKLLKTKLIALYDGPLQEAKSLQIEDLLENISKRLNITYKVINNTSPIVGSVIANRRVASVQNNRRMMVGPYDDSRSLEKSPSAMLQQEQSRDDQTAGFDQIQKQRRIVTSHELHKKLSCIKLDQQTNNHMIINENESNSRDQIYQMLSNGIKNTQINNNSLNKTNNCVQEQQMTKIIELCQVPTIQLGHGAMINTIITSDHNQVDFIQSNISPIKKVSSSNNDNNLYTQNTFDNGDSKESRIISVDQYHKVFNIKDQTTSQSVAQTIVNSQPVKTTSSNTSSAKHQSFIKSNMNHQALVYPIKQAQYTQAQNKENLLQSTIESSSNSFRRKPLHIQNSSHLYDIPLQIHKSISTLTTPQFNQNQLQLQSQSTPTNQILSHINFNTERINTNIMSPTNSSVQKQPIQNNIQSGTTLAGRQSSLNRNNENLNSIIENFRREKTVFNQKFQELKQKLETFNSPSKTQRDQEGTTHSLNQRLFRQIQTQPSQQAHNGGYLSQRICDKNEELYPHSNAGLNLQNQLRAANSVSRETIQTSSPCSTTRFIDNTREVQSSLGSYQQNDKPTNYTKPVSVAIVGNDQSEFGIQQYRGGQTQPNLRYQQNLNVKQQNGKEVVLEPAGEQYQQQIGDLSETTPVKQRTIRTGYE